MSQLGVYGEETWFGLGDRDLAAHIVRTARLRAGAGLTEVEPRPPALARAGRAPSCRCPTSRSGPRSGPTTAGSSSRTTSSIATRSPTSSRSASTGSRRPVRPAEVAAALEEAEVIVIAPSNPIVSVGPILAVPGLRQAIEAARAAGTPVVAVSGIVGGRALKGPADRMLASLGHESSALGVARLYAGLADGFVLDPVDADLVAGDRGARHADPRDRHDHDRRCRAAPGSPPTCSLSPTARAGRSTDDRRRSRGARRPRRRPGPPRRDHPGRDARRVQEPARRFARRRGAPGPRRATSSNGRSRRSGSFPTIASVLVVSPDPEVLGRRRAVRGRRSSSSADEGLNEGLDAGRPLRRRPTARRAVLILAADLPVVSARGDRRGRGHRRGRRPSRPRRSSRSSPDRHGRGTNALLLSPPDAIAPRVRRRQPHRPRGRGPGGRRAEPSSSTARSRSTSTCPTT